MQVDSGWKLLEALIAYFRPADYSHNHPEVFDWIHFPERFNCFPRKGAMLEATGSRHVGVFGLFHSSVCPW